MSDLKIFFNTRIENAGFLSAVGNAGLYPLQYLRDGDTIKIETESGYKITMNPTFDYRFDCLCLRMMKTVVAVALLIPGLILSLFKLAAYAVSSDVREKHALVKEYITESGRFVPITRTIGSEATPIKTIAELERALTAEADNFPANLTGALVIYGDGNLQIKEDPGILKFNPKRLIFIGAQLVHGVSAKGCLDEQLYATGKWQISAKRTVAGKIDADGRPVSVENADGSFARPKSVSTLGEALKAPADKMHNGRDYQMIYELPFQQTSASDPVIVPKKRQRLSLDDVANVKISHLCATSGPCKHSCVVTLKNKRLATNLESAYDIYSIVSNIADDIIISGEWKDVSAIREHFNKYSTFQPGTGWQIHPAEDVLNFLDFESPSS